MRRTIYAAALCGCLVMVAGCISYEQHITFESDGSGRVVLDTWVDYFDNDEGGDQAVGEKTAPEIGEELAPAFAGLKGVTIEENWTKVEGEEDNRREHTRLVLTFDKVERLNGRGVFENQKLSFKKKGKEFAFTQVIRNEQKEETEDYAEESEELARTLFEDYTLTYTVVMPGRVTDADGAVGDDGRTVTWQWPLYDFSNEEEITMKATSRKE
jgi:hypothetical protein